MKIKENYVLRQVAQTWIVMPLAEENINLNGMLTLTESGAMLWQLLEQGCDLSALADALTREYDVSEAKALEDADKFTQKLMQLGCLDAD